MKLALLEQANELLGEVDSLVNNYGRIQEVLLVIEGQSMKFTRDEEGEWNLVIP